MSSRGFLVLCAIAFFAEGLDIQAFGLALPDLARAWHLMPRAFATTASVGLAGFALGAVLGGRLGDRFGRRPLLAGSIVLFGMFTALSAWAHGLGTLAALRLLAGLGLGGVMPNGTALICESRSSPHRSVGVGICMMSLGLGGAASGLVAAWLLPRSGWSAWFRLCGAVAVGVGALLFALLPESPVWLRIKCVGLSADDANASLGPFGLLLSDPRLRADTVALCSGTFFLFLGWYAIFTWATVVLTAGGISLAQASRAMASFAFGGIGGNLLSGWCVRYAGTRVAFAIFVLFFMMFVLLQIETQVTPLSSSTVMHGSFFIGGAGISGFQTILFGLSAHVFPAETRSTGLGVSIGTGRIGAIVSAFAGIYLFNSVGRAGFFLSIGAAVLTAFGCVLLVRAPLAPLRAGGREVPDCSKE